MSLNATAVTELTVLTAPPAILAEWLALYFDGGVHTVGTTANVTFPRADIRFGQGAPRAPLNDRNLQPTNVEIRVVMLPLRSEAQNVDDILGTGHQHGDQVRLHFWVRVKAPGAQQSQYQANRAAELLHALLINPVIRYELSRKGIACVAPTLPEIVPSADYAERLVACRADIYYRVLFGTAVPLSAETAGSVDFFRSEPAIVGEFLLGYYQWQSEVTLAAARGRAWASQVSPTVFELEVNGVLTGRQLTVPVAGETEEVILGPITLSLALPAGQAIRWKCVSAPIPESAAWHTVINVDLAV